VWGKARGKEADGAKLPESAGTLSPPGPKKKKRKGAGAGGPERQGRSAVKKGGIKRGKEHQNQQKTRKEEGRDSILNKVG